MRKLTILNALSLLFNMLIVAGVVLGTLFMLKLTDITNALLFFTTLANFLAGLFAFVMLCCNIHAISHGKKLPRGVVTLKQISTVSLVIVAVVAMAVLPMSMGVSFKDLVGNFDFTNYNFYFHLIVPGLALISSLFFDYSAPRKWPVSFLAMIPVALYSGFYILNVFLKFASAVIPGVDVHPQDWYGIVQLADEKIIWLVVILLVLLAGAFIIALIIWLINNLITKTVKVPTPEELAGEEEKSEEIEVVEEPEPLVTDEPEEAEEEKAAEEEVEEKPEEEKPEEEPEEEKKPEPKKKAAPAPKAEKKPEAKAKAAPAKKAEPAKKEEAPKAEAKKAAPKAEPKKAEPAKKEESPKAEPKKAAPAASSDAPTKVYHLTKRKEDGMWAITFVGGQKAVKLFKTKKEAEDYLKVLTENQGATALIRNSKGAKAGKFASSIKTKEDE